MLMPVQLGELYTCIEIPWGNGPKHTGCIFEITNTTNPDRPEVTVIAHNEQKTEDSHVIGHNFHYSTGSTFEEHLRPYVDPEPPTPVDTYQPNHDFAELFKKK